MLTEPDVLRRILFLASTGGPAQPTRQVRSNNRLTEEWRRFLVALKVQMVLIPGPDVPGECGLQQVCVKNVLRPRLSGNKQKHFQITTDH